MGRRGAKLSKEDEEKVRAQFLLTPNIRATARALGYSASTVHAIVHKPKTVLAVLAELRSVNEMETRRRSWVSVGAIVLEKELVHGRLQHELGKEDPDADEIKKWAAILQSMNIAYGIDVEKARLLNEQATQITARADELRGTMPPGVTIETLVRTVRLSIGSEAIHPSLAEAASG